MGQPLALPHIIETMEISFFCAQRSCTLTHMGRVITNEVPLAVRSGDSVQIRVAAPEAAQGDVDPTEHLHFEDLTLMQRPAPSQPNRPSRWRHAGRIANEGQTQRCGEFQFDPMAPEYQPNVPTILTQSEFVQTLHSS